MNPATESTEESPLNVQQLLRLHNLMERYSLNLLFVTLPILMIGASIFVAATRTKEKTPPSLFDPVPFVFNAVQFVFNNERFLNRVRKALKKTQLLKFHLFSTPVILVSGERNLRAVFARTHKTDGEAIFVHNVFPILYSMPKSDVKRFIDDRSGRGRCPAPGTEHVPIERRYWFGYEHVHSEYLSRSEHFQPVAESFHQGLSTFLDRGFPLGQGKTVSLMDFCRRQVAEVSVKALFGPTIQQLNPGLLDAFWEFDRNIFSLLLARSRWLCPRAYQAQVRFYAMIRKYLDADRVNRSCDAPNIGQLNESNGGTRICRELEKWLQGSGFDDRAVVGSLAMLMFALLSNSVPMTMWMVLEIARDPSLLRAVREQVVDAYTTDDETGNRTLNLKKLVKLPLLQSIFTEVLRLHMNFNVIRDVNDEIEMDGFKLRKGSMLQALMRVAHHDEAIWSSDEHPASEFWAERHIKVQESTDAERNVTQERVFSMAGRPSSYFPFGGGHQTCPGRYLAKYEILTTVALIVSKFEVEPIGWRKPDGAPSDRPAEEDQRYSGMGGMPPDCDLMMRWKRVV